MTSGIILTICSLLLIAYIFDLTSSRTKIPSVILLLLLGWVARQVSTLFNIHIPDLTPFLSVLGTIGLILIVLEGSLELEFDKSKIPLIKKSFVLAFLPIVALAFLLAFLFSYYGGYDFKTSLLDALPFVVISSSIAIPSVKNQSEHTKEFVIYESSFSDILGILFFNFIAFNTVINFLSFCYFGLDLLVITVVSLIASAGLAWLLSKIDHHIKFAPIVILVILVYEIAKEFNLPALLFILIFGLLLGNLNNLRRFKWINRLKPDELNKEVHKFKELIIEGTFLARAVFFILFGYLLETHEIINPGTLGWSTIIVVSIFIIRAVVLKLSKLPLSPLLYIAPRGLINILLFISIVPSKAIPIVNKSLIVQVIIITALIMMLGLMFTKNKKQFPQIDFQ